MSATPSLTIDAVVETWPIAGAFVIARGAKREATVVVARVSDGTISGRGECVPYARYGETRCRRARCHPRAARHASRSRQPGAADAGGRRPQRARLRVVGLRGQALRHVGGAARRSRPAAPRHHGLHHQPRYRRGDGRKRRGSRAHHAPSEAEARRRGRRGAPAPGPRRVSPGAPHRRRQRGLDAGAAALAHGRRRRDRRRADRAAAARGRRCGARRLARGAGVRR